MYKLRFHLARGKNFMKWQVRKDNSVSYYNPDDYVLLVMNATLSNSPATAQRIYDGQHKVVCAWIEAEHINVYRKDEVPEEYYNAYQNPDYQLKYNPRVAPHWQDNRGNNIDNRHYPVVATVGKAVFEVPKG